MVEWVCRYVEKEWHVIRQAPVMLAVILLIGMGIGFVASQAFTSERMATLEARIAQKDDLISDLSAKSDSETASKPGFELTSELYSLLVQRLAANPSEVRVFERSNSQVSPGFRNAFAAALSNAHWEVGTVAAFGIAAEYPHGLITVVSYARASEAADTIADALREIGLGGVLNLVIRDENDPLFIGAPPPVEVIF